MSEGDRKVEEGESLVVRMRGLEVDHGPDGWPAVRMRDISALCDAVEGAIPALDLLQARLHMGAYINEQDSRWHLFTQSGEGIYGASAQIVHFSRLSPLSCKGDGV